MELNIGDKVRFLNDVGGGVIVKILPKNQALVQDSNEFEYPFPINELVLVERAPQPEKKPAPQLKSNAEPVAKIVDDNIEVELKDDAISEILFAFIRKNDDNFDGFECFIVNDSNFHLFYHVVLRGENGFEKIDAQALEPNTKIGIGELSRIQINSSKEITIQIVFYNHPFQTLHKMLERKIKIVPLKFFQEHVFIDNDFFDEKAYVFELMTEKPGLGQSVETNEEFELNLIRKDIELEEDDKSRRFKPRKAPETVEIDLHVNQLVESVIGMTSADIIKTQMDAFHSTITDAITNRVSKVILIHGIGNGTLKDAIRESLTTQYKLTFEDASFKEYGFGATEVILV